MDNKKIAIIVAVVAAVAVVIGVALVLGNGDNKPTPEPEKPGVNGKFAYVVNGSYDATPDIKNITGTFDLTLNNGSAGTDFSYSVVASKVPVWVSTFYPSIPFGPAESSGPGMYNCLLKDTIKVKSVTIPYEGRIIDVDVYGKTLIRSGVSVYYLFYVGSDWHVYRMVEGDNATSDGFSVVYTLRQVAI